MTENSPKEEKNLLDIVTNKMKEQTWIEQQDTEFYTAMSEVVNAFAIAIARVELMVRLYNEYGTAMAEIFAATGGNENDNVSPTQTIPKQPANRAEKRAAAKRKTPLDVVGNK